GAVTESKRIYTRIVTWQHVARQNGAVGKAELIVGAGLHRFSGRDGIGRDDSWPSGDAGRRRRVPGGRRPGGDRERQRLALLRAAACRRHGDRVGSARAVEGEPVELQAIRRLAAHTGYVRGLA